MTDRLAPLAQRLGSALLDEREEAMQALLGEGLAAGPSLAELARRAASPTLRARAFFTLVGIRLDEEARVIEQGPLLVALPRRATLKAAATAIEEQARLCLAVDPAAAEREVECSGERVPVLQALDELARAAGCAFTATTGGNYRLLGEPPAATPLCHRDSFRIALKQVASERTNDFRAPRLRGSFQIEAEADFLSPLSRPLLKYLSFEEAAGAEYPIAVTAGEGTPSRMGFTGVFDPPFAPALRGTLRGKLLYTLATRHTLIALDQLTAGAVDRSVEVDGIKVWIDSRWAAGYTLGIAATELPPETPEDVVHHLVSSTVLGIGGDGSEALATVSRRTLLRAASEADTGRRLLVHLDFGKSALGEVRALRLRVRHGLVVRRVPFHFSDVEL